MKEIVESGAIPSFSKYKLRKQAEEIVTSGHINYLHRDNTISLAVSLHKIQDDPESQRLADKLDGLIKSQPAKQGSVDYD